MANSGALQKQAMCALIHSCSNAMLDAQRLDNFVSARERTPFLSWGEALFLTSVDLFYRDHTLNQRDMRSFIGDILCCKSIFWANESWCLFCPPFAAFFFFAFRGASAKAWGERCATEGFLAAADEWEGGIWGSAYKKVLPTIAWTELSVWIKWRARAL